MIATTSMPIPPITDHITPVSSTRHLQKRSSLLLQKKVSIHHPKAGINPLVDAAAIIFSIMSKIKQATIRVPLNKLQHDLIHELNLFEEAVKHQGYQTEYILVCRYILCATLDELISHSKIDYDEEDWMPYSLLTTFNQDQEHQEKFFVITERTMKETSVYIDLMELIYLCLSLGYKGKFRSIEHGQYQLELIIDNLYKHIRAYRGCVSKTLSPAPIKGSTRQPSSCAQKKPSWTMACLVTACVIMIFFVSFCYLMDTITNEAYQQTFSIQSPASNGTII